MSSSFPTRRSSDLGDADRAILACEKGKVVEGDKVMALVGRSWLLEGRMQGGAVVATVMSNLGLERYLNDLGCGLVRTPVGARSEEHTSELQSIIRISYAVFCLKKKIPN